MSVEGLKELI